MRGKILILTICCLALSLILCGCGGGSAPPGSAITVNPSSNTVTDGSTDVSTQTLFYTISLVDAAGKPLGHTRISISFIWANPNTFNVVQLFDGTTPKKSPFDAETDDFGVYILRLDFQSGGGLKYTGNIEVRSGASVGSSTLNVQ
jgi:hypothetical protein